MRVLRSFPPDQRDKKVYRHRPDTSIILSHFSKAVFSRQDIFVRSIVVNMSKIFKQATGLFLGTMLFIATACAQNANSQPNAKTNHIMEQRLSFITIGAKDLNTLTQF